MRLKSLSLALAQVQLLQANNSEALGIDAGKDLTGVPGFEGVGFDDSKGAFHGTAFSWLK